MSSVDGMNAGFKIILVCLALNLCAISPAVIAQQAERIFSVGVVPQYEARKLHNIWRPLLDLLEAKTGYKFKLRGTDSIPIFEEQLYKGKFDFAYMNPYDFVIANEEAGYLPLVRDHSRKLHGILVVRKDSAITSPAQLDGKTLAFPAPNALGASLLIRQELVDQFKISFKPEYVKTHDSVYLNVLLGEAAAGGGVEKTLNQLKEEYRKNLRIILTTMDVAPHPLAVLPSVPRTVREHVQNALLEIGQSEQGRKLLSRIPIKEIGKASFGDYAPLQKLGLKRFYVSPPANPTTLDSTTSAR